MANNTIISATKIITTEKMVFGGDCIGKIDGKTVFVPFALPGETLAVEITSEKRDYDTARIKEILTPSPHRAVPRCPLYAKCGGCNMQHIESAYQRELRMQILRDTFIREGLTVPEIIPLYDSDFGYRARFQFHDGGLNARATNDVIPLNHCPVATDVINTWLSSVPSEQRPRGRVHVFGDSRVTGDEKVICAREREIPVQDDEGPRVIGKGGRTKVRDKRPAKPFFHATVQNPVNTCSVELSGKKIRFDVQGFFQSNMAVLEKTVHEVCRTLDGTRALDMYSGAGTFSVFLADCFEHLTLVEHNRDALVFAEQNLAGSAHTSYGESGERWVQNHAQQITEKEGSYDAVIIDPPRTGMERAVCDWLCRTPVPQVRSVSCDPATHARDIARLVKAGYAFEKLYLLDFYPQTGHIESLACLSGCPE